MSELLTHAVGERGALRGHLHGIAHVVVEDS